MLIPSKVFKAFAHDKRLEIFVLCAKGELTVNEITSSIKEAQPATSQFINTLYEAGLLKRREASTKKYYYVTSEILDKVNNIIYFHNIMNEVLSC